MASRWKQLMTHVGCDAAAQSENMDAAFALKSDFYLH